MSMEMNMNVRVTSLWMKTVENATKEIARECIMRCAEKYGFDGEEAISELFVKTDVVEMKKRSTGKKTSVKEVKEVKVKEVKEKEVKSSMILPFSKGCVNESGCCGLAFNQGLFTQCPKKKMEQGNYCKSCQKEADGSASGTPNNGTIEQRLTAGLMEFRDPKGRSPIRYSKLMEKQGLTREMVEEEARKFNYDIDEVHFTVEDKDAKRGRPKVEKKKKVVMNATVEDLFAKISFGSDSPVADPDAATEIMTDNEEEKNPVVKPVELTKDPEEVKEPVVKETVDKAAKAAEKAAKAEQLAAEKAAKAEQLAAEKAAKAEQLAAEKAAKAEKLAAEKAAKEEKLAAEKAAKAEKLAAEKAAKEEKKKAEPKEKTEPKKEKAEKKEKKAKTEKKEEVEKEKEEEPVPVAKKVTVTRITISGVQYLKSLENILYNPDTKEEMGIYDEETKTIQPLPDEDEEEMSELTADGYETN
jgi:hypothetical protein